jgi:tetratricopeptide (TPR) repeat protein
MKRAAAYHHQNQPLKCIADCTAVLEINPKHHIALLARATGYLTLPTPKTDEALTDCAKAIALKPLDAEGHCYHALAFWNSLEFDKAMKAFDRAIELEPDHVKALYYRGCLKQGLGLLDPAVADLSRVLELQPDHDDALKMRARVYWDQRQFDKALADVEQVVRLSPLSVDALRLHAAMLLKAERWAEASDVAARGLILQADDARLQAIHKKAEAKLVGSPDDGASEGLFSEFVDGAPLDRVGKKQD